VDFYPCHNGGIASLLCENGDTECGDTNSPKSLLYVAGWDTGRAWLNDELLHGTTGGFAMQCWRPLAILFLAVATATAIVAPARASGPIPQSPASMALSAEPRAQSQWNTLALQRLMHEWEVRRPHGVRLAGPLW